MTSLGGMSLFVIPSVIGSISASAPWGGVSLCGIVGSSDVGSIVSISVSASALCSALPPVSCWVPSCGVGSLLFCQCLS